MKQEVEFEDECEVEDAPVSPLLSEETRNRYGSVPGLDDEELADPCELERQVFLQEWGPVLKLPVRGSKSMIRPHIDESFGVDFGTFSTMDFSRTMPEFDKLRYKADKLQEKLQDTIIMLGIVSERLPKAKYSVLRYVREGIIELEDIDSFDMYQMAMYSLRVKWLQKQIAWLRNASWERRQKKVARCLQ